MGQVWIRNLARLCFPVDATLSRCIFNICQDDEDDASESKRGCLIPSEISLSRGTGARRCHQHPQLHRVHTLTGDGGRRRKSFNTALTPGGALYFHELIVEARNSAFCRTRVA